MFRDRSDELGLVGVVSMVNAGGAFAPGTLFLYPWLKPAGRGLLASRLRPALPLDADVSAIGKFIPDASLPPDRYLCSAILQLPWQAFIGFTLDVPSKSEPGQTAWRTHVPKLGDGAAVAIDWTSANLNDPWFGGSRVIPDDAACRGGGWRRLIAAAVNDAASSMC